MYVYIHIDMYVYMGMCRCTEKQRGKILCEMCVYVCVHAVSFL